MDKQKDAFILPEKWFVKSENDAQDEIIVEYMNGTFDTVIASGLGSLDEWYYSNVDVTNNYNAGDPRYFILEGAEEITFQQFLDYVVKQKQSDNYNEILIKLLTE